MRKINPRATIVFCCVCAITGLARGATHGSTRLSDPNNAALLYYQAFLLLPEVPARIQSQYEDVIRGDQPNAEVRRYVRRCRKTLELVEMAVRVPECDWGVPYSLGLRAPQPQFPEARKLAALLRVNTQILASDGDYAGALRQALTIRRIARHIGHSSLVLHIGSNDLERIALASVRDVLGVMPPNVALLQWLRREFAQPIADFEDYSGALRADVEMAIQSLRGNLENMRDLLVTTAQDEQSREQARTVVEEVLIQHAREPYVTFLDKALQVMGSDMTYAQKHAEIERLGKKLKAESATDPVAHSLVIACRVEDLGDAEARHQARLALFRTAVEIYLVIAETDQLPQHLADDWPTDPLTGRKFDYQITETGFLLRHADENIPGGGLQPFEFAVPDSDAM